MEHLNKITRNPPKVVMVCEDGIDLLDLYSNVLELRFGVIKVSSGCDCINKYVEQKTNGSNVDLLFLDYKLGDMLGDVVARRIKELNWIKIILISAYELDEKIKNDLVENKYVEKILQKLIKMRELIQEAIEMIC